MIRIVANAVLFRVSGLFRQVRNRCAEEPFLKRIKLITDCRSLLKFEITGIGRHLLLQLLHALRHRLFVREIRCILLRLHFGRPVDAVNDVADFLLDALRDNMVLFIKRHLLRAAAVRSVIAAFMESVI